jgi:tetratricopeptide (TPR) repeat protein
VIALVEESNDSWIFVHDYPEGVDENFNAICELFGECDPKEAEADLKALLLICPEHIDALHHLGLLYSETGRALEAYLCAREAVRVGLDAFPPKFSWMTSALEWGYVENRPFMRAYHALALFLLRERGAIAAREPFTRLVSINANDNLGARFALMQCLLDTRAWEAAIELARKYPGDASPDILYSKAVAFLHLNEEAEAIAAIKHGIAQAPQVARELLKPRHARPKSAFPGHIAAGGVEQAFDYWERNRAHWGRNTAAFKLLERLSK